MRIEGGRRKEGEERKMKEGRWRTEERMVKGKEGRKEGEGR